jgi:glutaredoxin 3
MKKNVTIYTTSTCPYCYRAKSLLNRKGIPFEEIDVTFDPEKRLRMSERAKGRRSVPQIFIGDTHVGGSDELHTLETNGKLDGLLTQP